MRAIAICLLVLDTFILSLNVNADASFIVPRDKRKYKLLKDLRMGTRRIFGGRRVEPDEFPYAVALLDDAYVSLCSGVLISPTMVLTAAHCANPDVAYISYFFGTPNRIIVPVEAEVRHPKYFIRKDPVRQFVTDLRHDIGLVYLASDVLYSVISGNYFQMRLPKKNPELNESVTAYGYGIATPNSQTGVLRKVEMHVVPCEPFQKDEGFICAAVPYPGEPGGSCPGDSGGPLVANDWTLVGVASLGTQYCYAEDEDFHNTFSSVSDYLPWLEYRSLKKTSRHIFEKSIPSAQLDSSFQRLELNLSAKVFCYVLYFYFIVNYIRFE